MPDNLLPQGEEDDSLSDYYLVRSFWPQVQAFTGQPESHEWMFARALYQVARLTLQHQLLLDEAHAPEQEQQMLVALEDVRQHEPLTRNSGFGQPYVPGDWFKIQACLGRVLPLVERLLLR